MMHYHRSHPVWVRGLKRADQHDNKVREKVAPRVGAWIETRSSELTLSVIPMVAPRVGAWIETIHYL